MIRYKLTLTHGDPIYLDRAEYDLLTHALNEDLEITIRGFDTDGRTLYVNGDHIVSIISEDIFKGASQVVTPPSPSMLQHMKDVEEANRDVSLDAQLSGEV